ncbi:MAG: hypothetical protein M3527_07865 [Actinomycetota bacterium]|nr:hypothetical protein [Acidimicrobiia bacterium]MDQ3294350.1 hypothetical protein [Actinomycetota bacterium]
MGVDVAVAHPGQLLGRPQEGEEAVADEVHGGLEAGDEQERGQGGHFVAGEPVVGIPDGHQGADESVRVPAGGLVDELTE